MDKTEEAQDVVQPITVPSVYQQTSVSKPVNTVLSKYGGHYSAEARDLKPSVKPFIPTEAANRGFRIDRTKTVIGAGSEKVTAQPEV